jgi:uncharacterized membrane protein
VLTNTARAAVPTVHSRPFGTGAARPSARGGLPWLLAAVFFLLYAVFSVARHLLGSSTAYDLGIFTQVVRSYAELRAPVSELKGPGFNVLGDHFHPLLVLLAPAYRVFPSPVTLLVAQALLLAGSVVPVTRLAVERLGPVSGGYVGVGYGLSWGLQQAVKFDFHEVALAVPLLALSLVALAEQRWRAAVLWAVPLLGVKEDLPATVAAIGAYLVLRRQWRLGLATVAGAVVAGLLIVCWVIPALNPAHRYGYAQAVAPDGQPPLRRLLTPGEKPATVLALLAPTLFLALRSPLVLLAVPTLLWRFWSTNPYYWGTGFHYSAVLMPIVFVALVDGLVRLRSARAPAAAWAGMVLTRLAPPAVAAVAVVATSLLPLRALVLTHELGSPAAARAHGAVLRLVPDGATVAASNALAPQLVSRCTVYLFPNQPDARVRPEWIAAASGDDSLVPPERTAATSAALAGYGYREVARRDGVVVYHLG